MRPQSSQKHLNKCKKNIAIHQSSKCSDFKKNKTFCTFSRGRNSPNTHFWTKPLAAVCFNLTFSPGSLSTVFDGLKSITVFSSYPSAKKMGKQFGGVATSPSSLNYFTKLGPSLSEVLSKCVWTTEIGQSVLELCECKEKVGRSDTDNKNFQSIVLFFTKMIIWKIIDSIDTLQLNKIIPHL